MNEIGLLFAYLQCQDVPKWYEQNFDSSDYKQIDSKGKLKLFKKYNDPHLNFKDLNL